jgi:hypothetical protein
MLSGAVSVFLRNIKIAASKNYDRSDQTMNEKIGLIFGGSFESGKGVLKRV